MNDLHVYSPKLRCMSLYRLGLQLTVQCAVTESNEYLYKTQNAINEDLSFFILVNTGISIGS